MDEKIKSNNKDLGIMMDEKIKSNNKDIGLIMDEKIKSNNKELLFAVGEMVEQNIIPVMDKIVQRLDGVDQRLDRVDQRLDSLERTVANLPDKQYLDDKLADALSEVGNRFAKRDAPDHQFKTTVAEIVEGHDLATPSQLSSLKTSISFRAPITAEGV